MRVPLPHSPVYICTYKSGNPQYNQYNTIPILVTIVIAIVIVIVFVHFQNCLNISFYNPLFEFDFMSGLLGQHTKVEKETERAREIMNHFQKIISTLSAWKPATSISQPNIHINSFIVYSSICKYINVYYVNVINKFVQLFFASVQKFVYKKISEFLFHLAVSPSPSVWCALFGLASISVFSVKVKVKASKHAQRGWLG